MQNFLGGSEAIPNKAHSPPNKLKKDKNYPRILKGKLTKVSIRGFIMCNKQILSTIERRLVRFRLLSQNAIGV